jgi:hypothetical protein
MHLLFGWTGNLLEHRLFGFSLSDHKLGFNLLVNRLPSGCLLSRTACGAHSQHVH